MPYLVAGWISSSNMIQDVEPLTILTYLCTQDSELTLFDLGSHKHTSKLLPQYYLFDRKSDILTRGKIMVANVKSRGAIFLEVVEPRYRMDCSATPESLLALRVQYIHRTVRNFLEKRDVWKQVLSYTSDTKYNAHSLLLKSDIHQLGLCAFLQRAGIVDSISVSLQLDLAHDYYAFKETGKPNSALLDKLGGE